MRQRLLSTYLEGTGISTTDIKNIAEQWGKKGERSFGHTFSDITQRFIPSLVLAAYPSKKISIDLALQIALTITPTPPFTAE